MLGSIQILVPQLGIEPKLPALEGGVATIGLPGKSQELNFLFLFGSLGSSVTALGLSLAMVSRGYCWLRCQDLSLQWLLVLQSTGPVACVLRSWGTRA